MKKTKDPNNRIPNETIELHWRMGYKISIDLTLRERSFRNSSPKLLDFRTTTSCFMDCYKIYIYWDTIRRCHCIEWEKIICNVCYKRLLPTRNWYINWDIRTHHCIACRAYSISLLCAIITCKHLPLFKYFQI